MKRLPILAVISLVSLVGMVGVSSAAENAMQTVITQVQNIQMAVHALPATVNDRVPGKPKMYYLTSGQVLGAHATFACSTGFHVANLFEIIDTSNLQYATGFPGAFSDIVSIDDQRDGPAVIDFGWVRTGYASTPDATRDPYESLNCNNGPITNWNRQRMGDGSALYDTVTASQMNSEWVGVCARQCNQSYHVWCVENM